MKVRYTVRALADREAIFLHIEAQSEKAARKVVGEISRRVNSLAEMPLKGRATSREGVFTLLVTPLPYRFFYRLKSDEIQVLHIRHTARRPWPAG